MTAPPRAKPRSRPTVAAYILPALLLVPWAVLYFHLATEWTYFPQYSYGFLMPILAGLLLYRRWQTRPLRQIPIRPWKTVAWIVIIAAIAFWFPLRVVSIANPDWRLASWTLALTALALSLVWIHQSGGFAWMTHFTFPFAFCLIAVPWPSGFEYDLIQSLTQQTAAFTVETLHWLGHSAVQQGNTIRLADTITVGVEEACSGIRSLQGNIMVALFLGEWFRRSGWFRLGLIAAGIVLAVLLNSIRSFALCLAAIQGGEEALNRWHDAAGLVILLLSFAALLLLSRFRHHPTDLPRPAPSHPPFLPTRLVLPALLLLVAAEASAQLWFATARSSAPEPQAWQLRGDQIPAAWKPEQQPVGERIQQILRYNRGTHYTFQPAPDLYGALYSLEWNADNQYARFGAAHSPYQCLPSIGAGLQPLQTRQLTLPDGTRIPFQTLAVTIRDQTLYAFFHTSADRQTAEVNTTRSITSLDPINRILTAWQRNRPKDYHVVQIYLEGCPDVETAWEKVGELILNVQF